jgi:hypothetical protein
MFVCVHYALTLFLLTAPQIDFSKVESNDQGVLVLKGHQIALKGGTKQATVLTFVYVVPFAPDAMLVKGRLRSDGGGIVITASVMPTPFFENADGFLQAVARGSGPTTEVCEGTRKCYKPESARLQTDGASQLKTICVAFPPGVQCNNRDFNDEAEGDINLVTRVGTMLATHPAFKTAHGVPVEFPISFAFWKAVQDGTEQIFETPQKADNSDLIANLMSLSLGGAGV